MIPEISIILPTYNGAKYIAQSIESCLDQSFRNFELIIVNDCSTDNTLEIIKKFAEKDNRIKIVDNKENLKLPLSLNKGFGSAIGRYFTWTSDDNYYAPDALAIMIAAMNEMPTTDLVYTNYTLINDHNQVTGTRIFNDVNESFHTWKGCGACFLYKSNVHSELRGYNPSFFLIEDYDFFVRAFTKFNFQYINKTGTYFYREHDASLTGQYGSAVNDVMKISLERNLPQLEKKLSNKEISLLYRKLAVFAAVQKNDVKKTIYFLTKLSKKSKKQVLAALLYIPTKKGINTIKVSFQLLAKTIPLLIKNTNQ